MNATPRADISSAPEPIQDETTAYAEAVTAGRIVAGPHVRAAALRHLKDLETAAARGLRFDVEAADYAIGFFRHVLCLPDVLDDDGNHVPFEPQPWQAFILGSLFGWLRTDGTRRFRTAYIETAKGSGKSPLAAGIGLIGLVADGEFGAEIYSAATKKDQAMILFRDAVRMVSASPHLSARLRVSGIGEKAWNLAYLAEQSFFRPISSDDGQSGPRPHMFIVDEVHEHKDGNVIRMGSAGQKSRRQPLILMITNSGRQRQSVCREYHEYAAQVAAGLREDNSFFGYVCANDLLPDGKTEEDPFEDPAIWPKTNPSLPAIPGAEYLAKQIREARGMPSAQATVRRLNFCQWVDDGAANWLGAQIWLGAGRDYDWRDFTGRRAWGGLDLSAVNDLTAFVLWIEPIAYGEPWRLAPFFWLPGQDLGQRIERDRVPYDVWVKAGFLNLTEGAAIDKLAVIRRIAEICELFDFQDCGYDRWQMNQLRAAAERDGLTLPPMVEFGQGFRDMSPAIKEFESRLRLGTAVHPNHPVLTWNIANCKTVADDAENVKFSKKHAIQRIDGAVAAAMGCGRTMSSEPVGEICGFVFA
jgi:phage terminase large subunit-like protein